MFDKIMNHIRTGSNITNRADREHEKMVRANEADAYEVVNNAIEVLADLGFVIMPVIKRKPGSRSHVFAEIELVPATREAYEQHVKDVARRELRQRQVSLRDEHAADPGHNAPECVACHPEQEVAPEHCAGDDCVNGKDKCECGCIDCQEAMVIEGTKALEEDKRRTCPECGKKVEAGQVTRIVEFGALAHKECLEIHGPCNRPICRRADCSSDHVERCHPDYPDGACCPAVSDDESSKS